MRYAVRQQCVTVSGVEWCPLYSRADEFSALFDAERVYDEYVGRGYVMSIWDREGDHPGIIETNDDRCKNGGWPCRCESCKETDAYLTYQEAEATIPQRYCGG